MKSENYKEYNRYLKNKSFLGGFYRKFLLFPKISRELSGICLDIGCGTGEFIKYRALTSACDINPVNVQELVELGFNARLIVNDKLPFDDDSFDSCLMDNVLEHIAKPKALIEEVKRVLKNHGCLVVGVPGIKGFLGEEDHKIFYNESSLREIFEESGFQIVKMFNTPFVSNFLDKNLKQYCLYGVFVKTN